MATANDVLNVARGEIGYSRWNDPETGSKYGRWYAAKTGQAWYGGNGVAYCAMFVSWVFDQAGASAPGLPGAYCPSMLAKGGTVAKKSAQPGDIVYFDWGGDGVADHVGIIEQNNGSYVTTIEGNTSNGSSGSQSNGGCVARRTRSWGVIKAIVRPTWGAATNKEDEVTDQDKQDIANLVWSVETGKTTADRAYRNCSMLKAMCGIGAEDTSDPKGNHDNIKAWTVNRWERSLKILKGLAGIGQEDTSDSAIKTPLCVTLSDEQMDELAQRVAKALK
jgi:hypothetical protein